MASDKYLSMKNLIRRILLFTFLWHSTAFALAPNEILVIANQKVPESVELAKYYMERRSVPEANLLLLEAPAAESCSWEDYEQLIADPVRSRLARVQPAWRIRCLVTMYGLPLKIRAPAVPLAQSESRELDARLADLVDLCQASNSTGDSEDAPDFERRIQGLKMDIQIFEKFDGRAALDSELALVRAPRYPLSGWLHNPYYIGRRGLPTRLERDEVLMVSRLDGPDAATVRRIIDDSLLAEAGGLDGEAYFDARYPEPEAGENTLDGYHFYDRSLHRAARLVAAARRLPVVLDAREALFQPGEARPAALYCGWYSLGHYVDAFQWQPGAVAYHIASRECATLKTADSRVWCKMLLEKGAAAVIGPVNEPYVQAFPPPELFFGALTDGYLTLAECYLLSLPHFSWKMVLVGDPLYRPFANAQ